MWLIVVQLIPGKNPDVSKLCFWFSFCVSFCLKGDGLQDDTFNFERAFDPNLFVCVRVCVCMRVCLGSAGFLVPDSPIHLIWLNHCRYIPDSRAWLTDVTRLSASWLPQLSVLTAAWVLYGHLLQYRSDNRSKFVKQSSALLLGNVNMPCCQQVSQTQGDYCMALSNLSS